MIALTTPPRLAPPTTRVRVSYLTGEQADSVHRGRDTDWLADAARDFDGFVADRVGVRERWGVPSEVFWFTSDEHYIGSLVVRHEPPEDDLGGHIGYHVVRPWHRRGHATEMLRQATVIARGLGIDRLLLTVEEDNGPSLRVIEKNGGVHDRRNPDGQLRLWIDTASVPSDG